MKPFFSIEQALESVAKTLIPARHNYIVNILPPDDAEARDEATPQVTSHHMEFRDGDPGLTVALPFAAPSEAYTSMAGALQLDTDSILSQGELDGTARPFLNLGSDAKLATRIVHYLLEHAYGYGPGTEFVCVVHDEGPIFVQAKP